MQSALKISNPYRFTVRSLSTRTVKSVISANFVIHLSNRDKLGLRTNFSRENARQNYCNSYNNIPFRLTI